MPDEKQTQETCAMDPWMALGIFLLVTGAGALTTVALYVKQIRQLKNQLEAAHNIPRQNNDVTNRTSASPPSEGAPNDRHLYRESHRHRSHRLRSCRGYAGTGVIEVCIKVSDAMDRVNHSKLEVAVIDFSLENQAALLLEQLRGSASTELRSHSQSRAAVSRPHMP
jgi:hypothetical protein